MKPPSVQRDVSLQGRNTLRLPGRAAWYLTITHQDQIPSALEWAEAEGIPVLVIGGGSNLVLASDFPGLVLAMEIRECLWRTVPTDKRHGRHDAILSLGAGENWHWVVRHACEAGYRGLENLALIPGTVGAAPVQNIGAYGAELADVLLDVTAWDRQQEAFRTLSCEECRFAYRDSLFKQERDRFIITRVRLHLSRETPFRLSYGELARRYQNPNDPSLTPLAVADTVTAVRQSKLPDPAELPNAGSFFKNPVISQAQYQQLKAAEPDLIAYPDADGYKLAAGWLIDQCGWKGYREAHVGVHARQALVLVNHAGGSGPEVMDLAGRIQADVLARFGVRLEVEPRIVGLD